LVILGTVPFVGHRHHARWSEGCGEEKTKEFKGKERFSFRVTELNGERKKGRRTKVGKETIQRNNLTQHAKSLVSDVRLGKAEGRI
jgi:hypothetical protein